MNGLQTNNLINEMRKNLNESSVQKERPYFLPLKMSVI